MVLSDLFFSEEKKSIEPIIPQNEVQNPITWQLYMTSRKKYRAGKGPETIQTTSSLQKVIWNVHQRMQSSDLHLYYPLQRKTIKRNIYFQIPDFSSTHLTGFNVKILTSLVAIARIWKDLPKFGAKAISWTGSVTVIRVSAFAYFLIQRKIN